jgi:hypothetical protein
VRFALVLFLAACAGSAPKAQTAAPAPVAKGDPTCPMEVPGTAVTVADTDKGGALVFVTTGDASALHARGDAFAAQHDAPSADTFAAMIKTPSTVVATHGANGERLEFTPKSSADASALQSELRMHASMLSAGSCKMKM